MSKQEFKQAVISLVIGVLISAVTVFLQGLIAILQQIPTELPGSVGGMAWYIVKTHKMYLT